MTRLAMTVWMAMAILLVLALLDAGPRAVVYAQTVPDDAEVAGASIEEEVKSVDKAREAYLYIHSYNRDPFESLILEKQPGDEDGAQKPPLESYDIELMKVVAIIRDSKRGYATVGLPDGKYYNVVAGTRIGDKGGQVYEVKSDRIIIKQNVLNFRRELVEQTRELKLREEEE